MSETGITVDIGTAHQDNERNAPSAFNARWTTLKSSLEAIIDNLADGQRQATNDSGVALSPGDLVYRSGWDSTNSQIKIKKAVSTQNAHSAASGTKYATHVVTTGGANGSTSIIVKKIYQLTGQNTSGATETGQLVYLSTTAGGWTLTLPAPPYRVQVVGSVLEIHASSGIIEFDIAANAIPFGSADDV